MKGIFHADSIEKSNGWCYCKGHSTKSLRGGSPKDGQANYVAL